MMTQETAEIPEGKLARGKIVGLTATKVGLKEIAHRTKSLFKETKDRDQHDEEIAKMVFDSLSLLRGTALKAAQLVFMEIEFLPEAYQKELSKACYKVPPINRALIRKTITSRLGNKPEKLFHSFQSTPFAAASLGQVHEAVSMEGETLAVKVQYPGIAESMDSDLAMVNKILRMAPKYSMTKHGLDEVRARLKEEVDYAIEAKNTRWFAERMNEEYVLIPEVIQELSSHKVLTTKKLEGLHLDEWLATNPSQEERNYYAQLMADTWECSVQSLRAFHCDPNPGNYLFRKDRLMGLIDFGCVKRLEPDLLKNYNELIRATVDDDQDRALATYDPLGLKFSKSLTVDSDEIRELFQTWRSWFVRPLIAKKFDFAENSNFLQEGFKLGKEFAKHFAQGNKNFIYLDRTWMGLYRLFEKMRATVNLQIDREYLPILKDMRK